MATTKVCPTCKEEKDLERFIKPLLWQCKDCSNRYTNEYRRKKREAYLLANPKPILTSKSCKVCEVDKPFSEFNIANRKTGTLSSYCKNCQKKLGNAWRATQPNGRVRDKCVRLKTTVVWYYAQLERQNNLCAICLKPEIHPCRKNGPPRALAMDHNHETGKVRGLLCFRCNTALHQLEKHGIMWAERAAQYLKET
jgi:hypothetical protein